MSQILWALFFFVPTTASFHSWKTDRCIIFARNYAEPGETGCWRKVIAAAAKKKKKTVKLERYYELESTAAIPRTRGWHASANSTSDCNEPDLEACLTSIIETRAHTK